MKKITKPQQKEIQEVLNKIGFNNKEIDTYIQVLNLGSCALTTLSVTLNMPNSTVQSILQRLYKQGLINITNRRGRKIYNSLEPKILKKMLQSRLKEIDNIIPLLNDIANKNNTQVNVYYHEHMADIFHQALECKEKNIYEIASTSELEKILGKRFNFTKRRVHRGIKLISLRTKTKNIKIDKKELVKIRLLPQSLNFESNIMFWDNTVAFFGSKQEGIAWVAKSETMVKTQKQLFDLLWKISNKIN